MQHFKIGDMIFSWDDHAYELPEGGYMEYFRVSDAEASDDDLCVRCSSEFYPLENYRNHKRLYRCGLYELYETEEGRLLIYHWATCRFGYGFFEHQLNGNHQITYLFNKQMIDEIPLQSGRFFSTAGMHSWLLKENRLILHASYVLWHDQAILFTAPSQTGKSTQARLWVEHEMAEIMNEDRALLGKREERWMAYGYPCSGSSPICVNHTAPLRAIVVLEQGPENEIAPMSLSEKVRALVSGSEVYIWNQEEIDAAFRIAQQLIMEVPVIKLRCRPDRQAVEVLKNYLEVMSNDAI